MSTLKVTYSKLETVTEKIERAGFTIDRLKGRYGPGKVTLHRDIDLPYLEGLRDGHGGTFRALAALIQAFESTPDDSIVVEIPKDE